MKSINPQIGILAIILTAIIPLTLQCNKECNEMPNKMVIDTMTVDTSKTDTTTMSCFPSLIQKTTFNGVSFVGGNIVLKDEHIQPIKRISSNWVAFMPFAFVRTGTHVLSFNNDFQWRGEKVEGIIESIELARKLNQKICLKLHVWARSIPYTGDYELATDKEWKEFEASYTEYVMLYAKLAQEQKVELFCIGVEFKKFVLQRTSYWDGLIKEVRKVYKGKITYAANWDEYKTVPFWKELDFIGVDGYFPLSPEVVPDSCKLVDFWTEHMEVMASIAKREGKNIIFTEYGYRSMEYGTKTPWDWNINHDVSMDAQSNAYIALFNSVWQQEWFEGGFLWKWYHDDNRSGGLNNNKFTPQNKPVEKVIKRYYEFYQ